MWGDMARGFLIRVMLEVCMIMGDNLDGTSKHER